MRAVPDIPVRPVMLPGSGNSHFDRRILDMMRTSITVTERDVGPEDSSSRISGSR